MIMVYNNSLFLWDKKRSKLVQSDTNSDIVHMQNLLQIIADLLQDTGR